MMPPKRKATAVLQVPPTKRTTRSSGSLDMELTSARPSTPNKKITTYKSRRGAGRNIDNIVESCKENPAHKGPAGGMETACDQESSEDELILSPSKVSVEPTPLPSSGLEGAVLSPDTLHLGSRKHTSSITLDCNNAAPLQMQPRARLPRTHGGPSAIDNQSSSEDLHGKNRESGQMVSRTTRKTRSIVVAANLETLNSSMTPSTTPSKSRLTLNSLMHERQEISTNNSQAASHTLDIPSFNNPTHPLRTHKHSSRKHRISDALNGLSPPPSPTKKQKIEPRHINGTIVKSSSPESDFDADIPTQLSPLKFDSTTVSSTCPVRAATRAEHTLYSGAVPIPRASPKKAKRTTCLAPSRLPCILPANLQPCLNAQKRVILRAFQRLPDDIFDLNTEAMEEGETAANVVAFQQLTNLLTGTITRGEGNSCLVLGPRGSGKTSVVEQCLSEFSQENPLILRLSGWIQHSDRLAMQEIAHQLSQQTGKSFLPPCDDPLLDMGVDDSDISEPNPFLDDIGSFKISLPPSHLPALISVIPTLSRPTIVVLDGFDLFALHPRQSLLYCLLDTAQSCRAVAGNKGLAVIGITNRIDTISILEKRVKSRFSGRMFRCAPPKRFQDWENVIMAILSLKINDSVGDKIDEGSLAEWTSFWHLAIKNFLDDKTTQTTLLETFSLAQDGRMLIRMLLPMVLHLSSTSPFPSCSAFAPAALSQRARPRFPLLHTLPYPDLCLLIASVHADTAGHTTFTFEMLHEYFCDQVRASTSAPVQINGGSIGMVRCGRQVLLMAFENLTNTKIFNSVNAHAHSVAKEFTKYRSVLTRDDVKKAVDITGQVNLRKWLTKAT